MTYPPPKSTLCNIPLKKLTEICEKNKPEVFKITEDSPSLSVLMPFYRARDIGWAAFESLCRQEKISFKWEIVIIEENFDEPMGFFEILKYVPRLKEVGCCRITYLSINEWVPLSAKWYYLGKISDQNSNVICFHSADAYSAPERLASQYNILSKGNNNWYKLAGNIVYDIESDIHVKFYSTDPSRKDTHSRATTREVLNKLPLSSIKTSVDGWMYNTLFPNGEGLKSYLDTSNIWKKTVNINGLNTISFKRRNRILKPYPPLYNCCTDINNHMPEDIVVILKGYVSIAADRRKRIPPIKVNFSKADIKKAYLKKKRNKKHLISIIGTRPQYVKVKPIYDYCLKNHIRHKIIDTNQHYSKEMSENIIDSLKIKGISKLNSINTSELEYISNLITELKNVLYKTKNARVLLYGDTNSTFCAALVCYKLGVKFGHIEAGARCFNNKVPEEINRIFADETSNFRFCFARKDLKNIPDGILCGDLEYELLNNLNLPDSTYNGPVVLTVHRKENLNENRIVKILNFCSSIKYPVVWPIHHSVSNASFFKNLQIPSNVKICQPFDYIKMNDILNSSRFVVSDSGGLLKVAPFFGKRILILRNEVGRTEVIDSGYGKFADFSKEDIRWASVKMKQDKKFFLYGTDPSKIIVERMNG